LDLQRPGNRRPSPRDAGFARFITLPENASAVSAVRQLVHDPEHAASLLYLHGPSGSGKSCLVSALAEERAVCCTLSANGFPLPWDQNDPTAGPRLLEARCSDLLIVEDLHHLPARAMDSVAQLIDERQRLGLALVVTANAGPAQLRHRGEALPVRLTNRLVSGLVVALAPLGPASRRRFLEEQAARRGLAIAAEILDWLAGALTGGGRQLEGALNQVATLAPRTLDELQVHWQVNASQPTVEWIVRRVSDYYRVEPRQLRSPRRQRRLMLPRQVSMYLARRLTRLSLVEIGAWFGGRDHTTVMHACRKVESAMQGDAQLSGAVRQLHAELE
jgi:chromosomal replication initiator protein